MRTLTPLVATLLVCVPLYAGEAPPSRGGPGTVPVVVEAVDDLTELPWIEVGHLAVPGFGSLINIGSVFGQYPQPPTLSGSTLFVPAGSYTTSLVIVDLADVAHPALVTDYTGITTRAVAVQGALLYSVDGYNRFQVLDISDVAHPCAGLAVSEPLRPGRRRGKRRGRWVGCLRDRRGTISWGFPRAPDDRRVQSRVAEPARGLE